VVPGSAAKPIQRDSHIQSIAETGWLSWQRQIGYGKRSKAETAVAWYKRIFGDHLQAARSAG
jgi:MarR-like DNA-binding transcriptional regulator SgrR of sgrS sRNA